jgi:dTMP kinase
MAGLFIVLEGPSGSGKSTLNKSLSEAFAKSGIDTISTKEPTSNFNPDNENKLEGVELAGLYLADRQDHVLNCILPSLQAGKTVICDRYIPSTMVYQHIEGIDYKTILTQNLNFPVPTVTVFLDVGIETLTKRVNERQNKTRFEADSFRSKEVAVYKQIPDILNKIGWNTMVIDSENMSVETITELIIALFSDSKIID